MPARRSDMVNDGLVLIGRFNQNLRDGLKFDDAIFEAGKSNDLGQYFFDW
jgi:hypothetical protein